jgi:uncharacterized protein (DUF2252 family)
MASSTHSSHLSSAERQARGKAARMQAPRSSHREFVAASDRPDPIALLEQQAQTRVQELVPIRYGRMLVSPLTFFRGAALIMASDLAGTPQSGLRAQLCGDAHLSNFGAFASPDRRLMFDLNDFDETLPGPWEWDVKRLAASLAVAGRERGFDAKERRSIVRGMARAYREAMRDFAAASNLSVWYARFDAETALAEYGANIERAQRRRAEKNLAKARTRDSMQAFEKLTTPRNGTARIVADPPLIVPVNDLVEGADRDQVVQEMRDLLTAYTSTLPDDRRVLLEQFRFVDMARKVVGVGSVGTRAWICLMLGRDGQDPLFLQAKEAQGSVLEEFAGASDYENSGERVVVGQQLMQAAGDILLGWLHVTGIDDLERDFYVRQLKDWKGSAEVEVMLPKGMEIYGRMCGWTLARAHARSGDRIQIASYLGGSDAVDRAIADFSEAYADQNERDYGALVDAVKAGRITAQTGL